MNKISESEESIEYNIEQTFVNGNAVNSFSNVVSYATDTTIFEESNLESADIFAENMNGISTRGHTVYPPSYPPPGIGATVASRVQFSLLVDASTVVGVIATFIPGANAIAFMSAAVSMLDIFLRRGLKIDTDRTYARIKIVSPALTSSYIAPWPAIGYGVRAFSNNPVLGYYMEITEYYVK
ncbi:hypothetical protein MmiHf6_14850 [Methanimicrococcus hongohii]|uniref:Uncharacterized protein n=1 Tax=Methanimicrococcus hongohii TaxID=3028295 RepID=A0AA96ZUC0_9EURY|nr:hypothetical protein [Methanimicrococcus sp. Hf6]WNY24156.1 hypothetical protein MmiHf6_14850 [Methanimicrococcus sp. Hf6]